MSGIVEVRAAGVLATVQDLGRPGLAHLGVSPSGAADRASVRLANRLVGNAESAAAIEVVLGGLVVSADQPTVVAVAGAPCPVSVGGRAVAMHEPIQAMAGAELRIGFPRVGLRTYVAFRGGLDVPTVLGSRSTDTLSGLGLSPLRVGSRLPVGTERGAQPGVDLAPRHGLPAETQLRVRRGPRADWFVAGEVERLCAVEWRISSDADRVGIRLDGPALRHRDNAELQSEAMLRGSVQVPRGGRPIIFSADHPVTGGYPVIAVVDAADMDLAAQARPGQTLRFRLVG